MAEIDVRARLPLHATWLVGIATAWLAAQVVVPGQDSHAYWAVWQDDRAGDLYSIAPGLSDAYNYSPLFAQVIWPLAQLPWPVFGVLWSAAAVAGLAYLLHPLGRGWTGALLLCCTPEILAGNVFWLLALAATWGWGRPRVSGLAWIPSTLTKVTTTVGPWWFLARREWSALLWWALVTTGVVALSVAVAPDLWRDWVAFLVRHAGADSAAVSPLFPPLPWRLPVALALVLWGARTDRPWVLPVGMVLATPVGGPAALTMLCAIPRIRAGHARRAGLAAGDGRPVAAVARQCD